MGFKDKPLSCLVSCSFTFATRVCCAVLQNVQTTQKSASDSQLCLMYYGISKAVRGKSQNKYDVMSLLSDGRNSPGNPECWDCSVFWRSCDLFFSISS